MKRRSGFRIARITLLVVFFAFLIIGIINIPAFSEPVANCSAIPVSQSYFDNALNGMIAGFPFMILLALLVILQAIFIIRLVVTQKRLKKANESILESADMWRTTVENASGFIGIVGKDHCIQYLNRSGRGIDPATYKGVSFYLLIHPDFHEQAKKDVDHVLTTGEPVSGEIQALGVDQHWTWYDYHLAPVYKDSEITALTMVCTDISLKKESEKAISESDERFKIFSEQSMFGIYIIQDEIVQYSNDAAHEMFEIDQNLAGKNVSELFNHIIMEPERISYVYDQLRHKQSGSGNYEKRHILQFKTMSGKPKWLEVFSRTVEFNGKPADFGVIIDITERVIAELAQEESESQYRTLVESMTDGLITIDKNRIMTYINPYMCRMLGFKSEELLGRKLEDMFEGDDLENLRDQLSKRAKGENDPYEISWMKKDGCRIVTHISPKALFSADGEYRGSFAVISDITENRRREKFNQVQRDLAFKLASSGNLNDVLEQCLEVAIEFSGMDCGGIYLVDADTGDLDLAASRGLSEEFAKDKSHFKEDSDHMKFLRKGLPVYTSHSDLPFQQNPNARSEKLRAIGIIPIMNDGELVACVNVASHTVESFPESSKNLLETVASQLGMTIARARTQEELAKTKSLLMSALEQTPAGIMISEVPANKIRIINTTALELLGIKLRGDLPSTGELINAGWSIHKPDGTRCELSQLPLSKAFRDGVFSKNEEYFIRRADGSERWILANSAPIFDPKGMITAGIVIFSDITDMKAAQKALADSEEKFRLLTENSSDFTGIVSKEGKLAYFSQPMVTIAGYPREEITKVSNMDFVHPDDRELIENALGEAFANPGKSIQVDCFRIKHRDGRYVHVGGSFTGMTHIPVINGVVLKCNDISDRIKAGEYLHRLKTAMEQSADGIVMTDSTGKINFVNNAWAEMHGETVDDLINRHLHEIHNHEQHAGEVAPFMNQLRETGQFRSEMNHLRKNGQFFTVLMSGAILKDSENREFGMLMIARDITELKNIQQELAKHREKLEDLVAERTRELEKAQEELIKQERLAALGHLVAVVSHEIRNPLGAITNSTYILKDRLKESPEEVSQIIGRIERNVWRCNRIIEELLDYQRSREINPLPTDIDELIDEVVSDQEISSGIRLLTDLHTGVVVDVDPERIGRCLINLIANAIQAIEERSSTVKPDHSYQPLMKIRSFVEDSILNIQIQDNGVGIRPDEVDRVFEPLFSTKSFGAGLGLPIVKQIVEQHGGNVRINSRLGEGTSVSICLPLDGKSHEHELVTSDQVE
jgi:PAS domain S-box-containing protein